MSSSKQTCSVCIEPYNKSNRKLVECFCEFKCCRSCIKTYFQSSVQDAHCMSCKTEWSRFFLIENFEKNYLNDTYKKHREDVLFEKQMGLMPETQAHISDLKEREKISKVIRDLETQIYNERLKLNKIAETTEKREFIRRCPVFECKGFLSTQLKCGICETVACKQCREVKNENHECDPSTLETIDSMSKDCKNCPKCGVVIYKISGCDQMFCSPLFGGCGIAFSWKTLKIETRGIHNPEYFEWRRRNNNLERNPDDILCGREIDHHFIQRFHFLVSKRFEDGLLNFMELNYIIDRLRRKCNQDNTLKARIEYMTNVKSKEEFKKIIQNQEKNQSKNREILNILTMFKSCATDIYYRLTQDDSPNMVTQCDNEIFELQKYCNECFDRVSKTYNWKGYKIHSGNTLHDKRGYRIY